MISHGFVPAFSEFTEPDTPCTECGVAKEAHLAAELDREPFGTEMSVSGMTFTRIIFPNGWQGPDGWNVTSGLLADFLREGS